MTVIQAINKPQWNLPERPPPISDHLTKILIGSSISQIAIGETSHTQPPPSSDHLSLISRVVTYGRFNCITIISYVYSIQTSCNKQPLTSIHGLHWVSLKLDFMSYIESGLNPKAVDWNAVDTQCFSICPFHTLYFSLVALWLHLQGLQPWFKLLDIKNYSTYRNPANTC